MAQDTPQDYSIWFTLPRSDRARWGGWIAHLARRHGAPVFEPHVTLSGGITLPAREALEKAEMLAAAVPVLTMQPGAVAWLDEYYRCLFVEIVKTPQLSVARRRAEALFGAQAQSYRPHLSLLYGRFDTVLKRRIASGACVGAPFTVREIALVRMAGAVADWRCVRSFGLAGNASG